MALHEPFYTPDELEALAIHEQRDEAHDNGLDDEDECTCYDGGLHALGSVASIRAGETDIACPHHGHEDYRR